MNLVVFHTSGITLWLPATLTKREWTAYRLHLLSATHWMGHLQSRYLTAFLAHPFLIDFWYILLFSSRFFQLYRHRSLYTKISGFCIWTSYYPIFDISSKMIFLWDIPWNQKRSFLVVLLEAYARDLGILQLL